VGGSGGGARRRGGDFDQKWDRAVERLRGGWRTGVSQRRSPVHEVIEIEVGEREVILEELRPGLFAAAHVERSLGSRFHHGHHLRTGNIENPLARLVLMKELISTVNGHCECGEIYLDAEAART